jgi:hypothetical protein
MSTLPVRTGQRLLLTLASLAPLVFLAGCPTTPVAPPTERLVLAYAAGGLPEQLVVRSSIDGHTWVDQALNQALPHIQGVPLGVAAAADAGGAGRRVAVALVPSAGEYTGPAHLRSFYGLQPAVGGNATGTLWGSESDTRDDLLQDPADSQGVMAPLIAPLGADGQGWLLLTGTVVSQDNGTPLVRPKLWVQPTGAGPLAELGSSPWAGGALLAGRPALWSGDGLRHWVAWRDAGPTAQRVVVTLGRPGAGTPGNPRVTWGLPGTSPVGVVIPNAGLPAHRITDLCLTGRAPATLLLAVSFDGPPPAGPTAPAEHVLRLFRSDNGGASFSRLSLQHDAGGGVLIPIADQSLASSASLGCASVPGGLEWLVVALGRAPEGSVATDAFRIDARGVLVSEVSGSEGSRLFVQPPQLLPFALFSAGRAAGP